MQELKIASTRNSPEIRLSPVGFIKIKGRSIHPNIVDFFRPVEEWVNEYIKNPAELTSVDINLEYCNSASSKILVRLFQKISHIKLKHKKFVINWYYEDGDEDILERGEYFSSVLNIPFNFIKTSGSW